MSDFADLARRALSASGYSMRSAARAMSYDPAYLSRALNGKQRPSPALASSLDELLGAGGSLAATVLGAEDRERVKRSTENPSRVDAGTVEALAGVLSAYRRLDDVTNPKTIVSGVLKQTKDVTQLLQGARGPYRGKLTEVASEWLQFAGWTLSQVRRNADAERRLDEAVALAGEAGNGTLAAQALHFRGGVARQQNRAGETARWYSAAANTTGAHPAQQISSQLRLATAMATAGEPDAASRVMGNAEKLMEKAAELPPPETAYWLSPEWARCNLGSCALALGRYSDAADHFRAGIKALPAHYLHAHWAEEWRAAWQWAQALS